MNIKEVEINNGVTLHIIKTDRFKTNCIFINLLSKLDRSTITKNALLPLVLRRGTKNYPTMKDISIKLEDMYGASLDANTEKVGNYAVIQFMMDMISDEYTLDKINILKDGIGLIDEVLLNPYIENGCFKKEYVEQEKETLKELINSKINDKSSYASDRTVEEMYANSPYGIYKLGYVEDLDGITEKNLYDYYKNLLQTSIIHIYVSGNVDEAYTEEVIKNDFNSIERQFDRNQEENSKDVFDNDREVIERQNVIQGKLVFGYEYKSDNLTDDFYKMALYSAILGGTASSKLFNNVREKKSLAYTIRSQYIKHKGALFVSAGIEINNFDVAKESILKEIEDMRIGNITDEELNDARVNLITAYRTFNDSQSALIGWLIGQRILGAPEDVDVVIEKLQEVTKEEIVEAANRLVPRITYFLTA